jgi:hypothetical protein
MIRQAPLVPDQVGGRVPDGKPDVPARVVRTMPVRRVAPSGDAVPRLREHNGDLGVPVVAASQQNGDRAVSVAAHPAPGVLPGTVDAGASTEPPGATVRIAATRSSRWVVSAKELKILAARDH